VAITYIYSELILKPLELVVFRVYCRFYESAIVTNVDKTQEFIE